jgi:hypothetical protein
MARALGEGGEEWEGERKGREREEGERRKSGRIKVRELLSSVHRNHTLHYTTLHYTTSLYSTSQHGAAQHDTLHCPIYLNTQTIPYQYTHYISHPCAFHTTLHTQHLNCSRHSKGQDPDLLSYSISSILERESRDKIFKKIEIIEEKIR